MNESTPACAKCPYHWSKRLCNIEEGKGLDSCPTQNKKDLLTQSLKRYEDPEIAIFAKHASIQEGEGYQNIDGKVRAVKPRLLETVEFARKMHYGKLGFIFCEGLADEAKVVNKYLEENDFEVVSIVCKAGRTPKEQIGILDEQKILPGTFEPMCNPIYQACIVNEAEVDFNIIMGLCVGHDSLAIKHLEAPVTVLAAKDRILGHNPLAAVYQLNSYYAFLK